MLRGHLSFHRWSWLPIVCLLLPFILFSPNLRYTKSVNTDTQASASGVFLSPHFHSAGRPQGRTFACQKQDTPMHCYGPAQIRQAYAFQPILDQGITGKGRTIVIISAYGSPHLFQDLHAFDRTFGLADPELRVFYPQGPIAFDPRNKDQARWFGETMLDIEWAHVTAPDAAIALVLVKSGDDPDMIKALRYAVDNDLGDVISMSFGENEQCVQPMLRSEWHRVLASAAQKQMTLLAATGDTGAAQLSCDNKTYKLASSLPAVDPLVTAVGGTQLFADYQSGAYREERAWNEPLSQAAGGGGFSTSVPRPDYQSGINDDGQWRGVPDVAYNAAYDGGFLVAWSDGPRHSKEDIFYIYSGTSAGTPQWAGIVALADQMAGRRLGPLNPALYAIGQGGQYSQAFHDIDAGDNSVTLCDKRNQLVKIKGYNAAPGWDAVTGWGTPIVEYLVPLLVAQAAAQSTLQIGPEHGR